MQSAFVDLGLERDGFLYVEDAVGTHPVPDEARPAPAPTVRIENALKEGQEIVVQVAKEPMGQKGARITAHVALPGRFLVFLPGVEHVGVSRRIEDPAERERLRALVEGLGREAAAPGGFIVRTAGLGLAAEAFAADVHGLVETWRGIRARAEAGGAPGLLHAEAGAVARALRDLFDEDVAEVVVDSDEVLEESRAFMGRAHPPLVPRIRRHDGAEPLFRARGIEIQIERALRSKVWLKSGGHIVVNHTEALVAIDVNTGKYVGRSGLEETIVRTNLEAVREVVRQIRLRDLGGIIVVDFIDMQEAESRAAVVAALEQELRRDRARSRVLQISEFGLVEITRQRTRPGLERLLCHPCPACAGSGVLRSLETTLFEIVREVRRLRGGEIRGRLVVRLHPDAAAAARDRSASLGGGAAEILQGVAFEADAALRPDQWTAGFE
jgi:ribonuclease G